MKNKYDAIVLGAGAAGLTVAGAANTLGAKTLLIEKKNIGGDCTWFGCIPSKTLLKSAQVAHTIKHSAEFGITGSATSLETNKVLEHVREAIQEIAKEETPEVLEKRGIKVIFGSPRFVDKNTIEVNGDTFVFKKCFICTGSGPVIPPIEGLKEIDYLTNETIFDLKEFPQSIVVLGGGPIGVELSQALARLGVKVSIVEMVDRILFREEKELATYVENQLKKEGIDIFTGKKAVKFEKQDGNVVITLQDSAGNKETISAQTALIAVGRAPNVEGLDLEKGGVEYNNKGVITNDYLQTTNKNIYACGDVVGPYQFSHVASYQGQTVVRNALFKKAAWQKVNYTNICWATFTDPELAHCGLTEEEAREKFKDIKVYTTEYAVANRAVTDSAKDGLLKIIIDKKGFLLGAHVVGKEAGEIIQGFILAKSLKIPVSKLAQVMYIYPTLSELIKKTAAKPLLESLNNPLIKFVLKLLRRK